MRIARLKLVACAVSAALALVGWPARPVQADHCDGNKGNLILFSGHGTFLPDPIPGATGVKTANTILVSTKAYGCNVGEDPNTNYIYPGSNLISVRYIVDGAELNTTLPFTLSGLATTSGTLTCLVALSTTLIALVPGEPSPCWYESGWMAFDPAASMTPGGTIVVAVPGEASDTYRTTTTTS